MSRELFSDICLLIGVAGVMQFFVALWVLLFWRSLAGDSMNDNRDETVPASDERHELHDPTDDSTPPTKPNSGTAVPIDGDAWE